MKMITLLNKKVKRESSFSSRLLLVTAFFLFVFAGSSGVQAQVTTLQNWSNLYNGTSTATQNITYTSMKVQCCIFDQQRNASNDTNALEKLKQ